MLGTAVTIGNPDREHPRVQRYRASVQRELWGTTAIEVAYNYQVGDRLPMTLRMDYLPEEYWNGSNVRDVTQQNFLQTNVPNPFLLSRFSSLQATNPALYARMAGNAFFTNTTVQLNRLLRGPYPQYSVGQLRRTCRSASRRRTARDQLHASFQQGLRPERGVLGQPDSQSGVPERVRPRADALAAERQRPAAPHHGQRPGRDSVRPGPEVPEHRACLARFSAAGRSAARSNTSRGRCSRGATSSSTAISTTSPSDDPTLDRWFNVDAGFERDPAKAPANFQKRVFPFRIDGVQGPEPDTGEHELHADGDAARSPFAELPGGHDQPAQPDDVRQPESEPDVDRLRPHHERDRRFATVHPVRDEVHVLAGKPRLHTKGRSVWDRPFVCTAFIDAPQPSGLWLHLSSFDLPVRQRPVQTPMGDRR